MMAFLISLFLFTVMLAIYSFVSRRDTPIRPESDPSSYLYPIQMAYSTDGKKLSVYFSDDTLMNWNLTAHELENIRRIRAAGSGGIAYSSNGRFLAIVLSPNTVLIVDPSTGTDIRRVSFGTALAVHIARIRLSNDGQILVGVGKDSTLVFVNTSTGDCTKTIKCDSGTTSLAIAPDKTFALSGHIDGTIRKWNVETGVRQLDIQAHESLVSALDVDSTGTMLLSGCSDGSIRMWNADNGKLNKKHAAHSSAVITLALTLDGKKAFAGGLDNLASIWDIDNERVICLQHREPVYALCLSPGGEILTTGASEHAVIQWEVSTGKKLGLWFLKK